MKKHLLLFVSVLISSFSILHAQVLSSNVDNQAGYYPPSFDSMGHSKVVFDDVDVPMAIVGTSDSISVTKLHYGILRNTNAQAVTLKFYYSTVVDTATFTDNYLAVPPIFIDSVNLPANPGSFFLQVVSIGDSINPLFTVKSDTNKLMAGTSSFFVGVSFSTNNTGGNGWELASGGTPNVDSFWQYYPDRVINRRALAFGGNPPPPNTFYLEVFGTPKNALPVTFMNFDGVLQNGLAVLNWRTANEINNKGFEVQKSLDGQTFSDVAFVQGAGNSSGVNSYNYTDVKVLSGSNYYRLKQIDLDGRFSYSSTIKLDFSKFDWAVLGNPAANNSWIQLQLDKTANVSIQIVSINGKIMQTINKGNISRGTYTVPLNLNNSAPGMYVVKLIVNNQTYSKQIIK